jgi:uncharacterized protein related to proFAR isomerase
MKSKTSKTAIIGILGVSSIVLASTYRDMKSQSVVSSKLVEETDMAPLERSVASEDAPSKVAQLFLPLNEENIKKINSSWEISRVVDNTEKVIFDKFQNVEDSKKSLKVKMELVGNGIVRLDNDNEQVYRVSILTDFGTIAIFKKLGNGFEIIEAKRVVKSSTQKQFESAAEEVDLVLERALNQSKGNKVLVGGDVGGQLTLKGNNISNLSVSLHNQNGEDQSIEIDSADILDGGAFKADVNGEEISGVLFNNGKEGFRLSFVTGPMAGAMLNFVTKAQFDEIQEKEESINRDQADQGIQQEEVKEVQAPAIEERQVAAENLPEEQKLSVEEIKEVAQERGFAF